jgi:hypothetical protein
VSAVPGRDFSLKNKGQRKQFDFYETPYSMTRQLLAVETFPSHILEPACGNGAIVRILKWNDHLVTAYDKETDFLKETRSFPAIVTNPPFSLSFEFIQRAKTVAEVKFAFLMPLSYLHGNRRYVSGLYTEPTYPLARLHVFTMSPVLGEPLRIDGKFTSGMVHYAWYIWERGHVGPPTLGWINNYDYVIHEGDDDVL